MVASNQVGVARKAGDAAKTVRTPSRTGGYFVTRKARNDAENYAEAMRRIHDPGTEHYLPMRGIVTRSHTGIVGEFPSTKVCGASLPYESQNELKAFLLRETDPRVKMFHAQPLRLVFGPEVPQCRYTADILTVYWDGRTVLEEVKPKKLLDHPVVRERHRLAREAAADQGWGFEEVSDEEVNRQPRLANAKELVRYGNAPLDGSACEAAAFLVSGGRARTMGDLERKMSSYGIGFTDLIAMAARGCFDVDMESGRLGEGTDVRTPRYTRRFFG